MPSIILGEGNEKVLENCEKEGPPEGRVASLRVLPGPHDSLILTRAERAKKFLRVSQGKNGCKLSGLDQASFDLPTLENLI